MAITYPTSLDAFTNPTATSLLTSPDHAQQHSDLNDAVEALEAKVAIGNTVLGTYTDYSASMAFTNVTVGNGTKTAYFARVNNFVHFYGSFILGSTSAITGGITLTLPLNIDLTNRPTFLPLGLSYALDASSGINYPGDVIAANSPSAVVLSSWITNATYAARGTTAAAVPFTWAVSDTFFWNIYYRAA